MGSELRIKNYELRSGRTVRASEGPDWSARGGGWGPGDLRFEI